MIDTKQLIDRREARKATDHLLFTDRINGTYKQGAEYALGVVRSRIDMLPSVVEQYSCKNYDFFKAEMERLCSYYKGRCNQCPLNSLYRGDCLHYLGYALDQAVEVLQEWSDKTPDNGLGHWYSASSMREDITECRAWFCSKCDTEIYDYLMPEGGFKFCPHCGKEMEDISRCVTEEEEQEREA